MRLFAFIATALIFASGASAASSNYQTEILSHSSLKTLFKMNEASGSVSDSGPNAYTATANGSGYTYSATALEGGASPPTAISVTNSGGFTISTSNPFNTVVDYNLPFVLEALVKIPSGALPSSGNKYFPLFAQGTTTNWFWGVDNSTGSAIVQYFSPTSLTGGIACGSQINNLSVGATHHIAMVYRGSSGSFSCSDLTFYNDGIPSLGTTLAGSTPGTGSWNNGTVTGKIGAGFNSTAITVQDIAVYNVQNPNGATSRLGPSSNSSLDINSTFHSLLYQNNGTAPTPPTANSPMLFEKDCSDSDDWTTFQILADGVYRNTLKLYSMASNARNTHCASAFKALLHFWGLDNVPVASYQGTSTNYQAVDDGYAATETQFRSWDGTDVGITAWTIGSGGSGYAVGDIVQVPGGVLETHDATQAQQYKVLTVSGSAIATLRPYYGSTLTQMAKMPSYSTAPSCAPCTLTTITGGGSGATLSAITTSIDRGNFADAEWLWTDIIAANPGVYIANGGQSAIDALLVSNHLSTLNSNVPAIFLMQCDLPSRAYWASATQGAGPPFEYNCGLFYTDWQSLNTNYTGNLIYSGVENTNPEQGGTTTWPSQGWIVGGFTNTLNYLTNPGMFGFYSSSTAVGASGSCNGASHSNPCMRTFWDLWVYWFQYAYQGTGSKGGWMVLAGGNQATAAYTSSTGTISGTLTSGAKAYYLRRTQDTAINTDIATIMAESPATFVGGGGLPVRGLGMNEPANDNVATAQFRQALYSALDSAIVAGPRWQRWHLASVQ